MLDKRDLTLDQIKTVDTLYEQNHTLVVAPMGGGKTVCTLTAASELMEDDVIHRLLVVAPRKVAIEVWPKESEKWGHLADMDVAVAIGTPAQRCAALQSESRVVVINFENLPWLFRETKLWESFDALVIDEISKLKNPGGSQFKALRPKLKNFIWRVGLTGTPVSEDWQGLYAQMVVVDGGRALGTCKDLFLNTYFIQKDFKGYKWELRKGGAEAIAERIASVVWTMPDYRSALPDITYKTILMDMPPEVVTAYEQLRNEMLLEIEGEEIAAESAAVLVGKLQQLANGFVYTSSGDTERLSSYRFDTLSRLVKTIEAPVVIAYWYRADGEVLREMFPNAADLANDPEAGRLWNERRADVLLLHPRSAGHGLQLEQGGSVVVWFGPVWSRDLWEQTNARVWRRGQREPVSVYTLAARGSIDELIMRRVKEKAGLMELFKAHINPAGDSRQDSVSH